MLVTSMFSVFKSAPKPACNRIQTTINVKCVDNLAITDANIALLGRVGHTRVFRTAVKKKVRQSTVFNEQFTFTWDRPDDLELLIVREDLLVDKMIGKCAIKRKDVEASAGGSLKNSTHLLHDKKEREVGTLTVGIEAVVAPPLNSSMHLLKSMRSRSESHLDVPRPLISSTSHRRHSYRGSHDESKLSSYSRGLESKLRSPTDFDSPGSTKCDTISTPTHLSVEPMRSRPGSDFGLINVEDSNKQTSGRNEPFASRPTLFNTLLRSNRRDSQDDD